MVAHPRCQAVLKWSGFGKKVEQQCRKKAVDRGYCTSCAADYPLGMFADLGALQVKS